MTRPCARTATLATFLLLTLFAATPAAGLDDTGLVDTGLDDTGAQKSGPVGTLESTPPRSPAWSNDEQVLRTLKTDTWPRAYRTQDVALLDSILAEEFVLIDAIGGITDRHTELATLPDYRWTHDRFDYRIDHLEILDNHTAVVAGTGEAHGTRDDTPYCLTYRSSNVLVRRNDNWRAVLSHVSGVDTDCENTD